MLCRKAKTAMMANAKGVLMMKRNTFIDTVNSENILKYSKAPIVHTTPKTINSPIMEPPNFRLR